MTVIATYSELSLDTGQKSPTILSECLFNIHKLIKMNYYKYCIIIEFLFCVVLLNKVAKLWKKRVKMAVNAWSFSCVLFYE